MGVRGGLLSVVLRVKGLLFEYLSDLNEFVGKSWPESLRQN